jgi:formate/nitrite transporter FocA (FNT family)
VAKSPDPSEVLKRAVEEGERRLDQSRLELTSTGFIAGLTIVFGIATLAILHALVEPRFGELVGALGFGIGMVFLIVRQGDCQSRGVGRFFQGDGGPVLVTLMSYLLRAVNGVGSRIIIAYLVGVLLAVGIFDHAIVTILHVFLGILFGAEIGFEAVLAIAATVTAGNLIGGLGLVTLTHTTQAEGARESDG